MKTHESAFCYLLLGVTQTARIFFYELRASWSSGLRTTGVWEPPRKWVLAPELVSERVAYNLNCQDVTPAQGVHSFGLTLLH